LNCILTYAIRTGDRFFVIYFTCVRKLAIAVGEFDAIGIVIELVGDLWFWVCEHAIAIYAEY